MIEGASRLEDVARPGSRIGHRIEVHGSIGSTSDRSAELLRGGQDGIAVVAELQTSGRGRRGRTWTSPAGVNLTMSVGVTSRLPAADGWRLGLAVALAVRSACASVAPVALKWPNDLVDADDRKLGGVLVETTVDGEWITGAVIGIGINVNWSRAQMPAEIVERATSLAELAGAPVDRGALLGRMLASLELELEGVEGGRSPLERYRAACSTLGRQVDVETGGESVSGTAIDLDADGALLVATTDGTVAVTSGEVTRVHPGEPS